jgi:hypothetical protein
MVSCLALQGEFAIAQEALFYRRMDPKTATILMSAEDDIKHHYPVMSSKALFPTWRLYAGWCRAVWKAPVPASEQRAACVYIARMSFWEWKEFFHDLASAVEYFVHLRWLKRQQSA